MKSATRIWNSPLGPLMGIAGDAGLRYLGFVQFSPDYDVYPVPRSVNGSAQAQSCLNLTGEQLNEFFSGDRKEFTLPLDPQGTAFQQRVWKALEAIPYGETRTYKEQTTQLGDPLAIRAVARTNGQNPIAIIIPCHRVIGSDGSLTGYAGGLPRKRWLLDHERALAPSGQVHLF